MAHGTKILKKQNKKNRKTLKHWDSKFKVICKLINASLAPLKKIYCKESYMVKIGKTENILSGTFY